MVARSLQSLSVSPNHVKKLSWATGAPRLTTFSHHAYDLLSNSEPSQVKTIKQIASRLKDLEIEDNVQYILAGDWNLIFDRSLDAMGAHHH